MSNSSDTQDMANATCRDFLRRSAVASAKPNGYEVGYKSFSINGTALGHGEPVRVRCGQRVMFRILNASATENIQLALPGHQFEVVALDGNRVPSPTKVSVLAFEVAEDADTALLFKAWPTTRIPYISIDTPSSSSA